MPVLVFEPRDPCQLCGCRLRGVLVGSYRINKSSFVGVAADRGTLSVVECPECGPSSARRHPLGTWQRSDRWRLDPKSQALVDAHRARKGWS